MTSAAFWAHGAAIQLGDGETSESFTSIAEIKDLKPPPLSRDSIEVTSHGSTSGYKEFISGLRDGGEVGFECNWLPTNATQDEDTGLLDTFDDDDNHNWRIVLPDSILTISFAGFITKFEPELPVTEQGKLSISIKVTGAVTVA